MGGVTTVKVVGDDDSLRLDRWFSRYYPSVTHSRLQKLLRTGQVRVDGHRAKANKRLLAGQIVRVPPVGGPVPTQGKVSPIDVATRDDLRARVLYRDNNMLALDKPAGLAVQGGSGQRRHLDALSEALRFDADEPPRLVHRLDKETSGVLLLARHRHAARDLTRLFRDGEVAKTYWAVVAGVPRSAAGEIDRPLTKGTERVEEDATGRPAVTHYRTISATEGRAWLVLSPLTGRTHQLRVHCALIGVPILGDRKYGGPRHKQLHLHARELVLSRDSGNLRLTAPLPAHMVKTFAALGFDEAAA
jgi:23S rRNA pseudouridine955/2504/2580 synthase